MSNIINSQLANDNYAPESSYVVDSEAFVRVEFGSINLPSFPVINAVLIEFHSGSIYLYVGVPNDVYSVLMATVARHISSQGRVRVGSAFNQLLFNSFPSYARLHQ